MFSSLDEFWKHKLYLRVFSISQRKFISKKLHLLTYDLFWYRRKVDDGKKGGMQKLKYLANTSFIW